jgi:Type IX secretion system protein PorV
MILKKLATYTVTLLATIMPVFSQVNTNQLNGSIKDIPNPVETTVPFLTIAPESRGGGMADIGAATSPDVNSMHWNPAKFAFIENKFGASFSYTPWLHSLVNDINLAYLSGYYRIDRQSTVAASLRYFSLGEVEFRNDQGDLIKPAKPNEMAVDAAYSRLFGQHISGGLAFRYINSNLASGATVNGVDSKPGWSLAVDASVYYTNKIKISDKDANLSFGLDISNIGKKISYGDDLHKEFIPTNMRLGGALTLELDEYNSLTFAADLNKLLVPTQPIYWADSTDSNNNKVIRAGKDPNVSVVSGIFQSFYDAPGGFTEELHEVTYSLGFEYWYRKQLAFRGGYFHENQYKGNRKFFTVGLGLRLNVFGLDFSYLVPTNANNPLANTLRFTLIFDFGATKKTKKE